MAARGTPAGRGPRRGIQSGRITAVRGVNLVMGSSWLLSRTYFGRVVRVASTASHSFALATSTTSSSGSVLAGSARQSLAHRLADGVPRKRAPRTPTRASPPLPSCRKQFCSVCAPSDSPKSSRAGRRSSGTARSRHDDRVEQGEVLLPGHLDPVEREERRPQRVLDAHRGAVAPGEVLQRLDGDVVEVARAGRRGEEDDLALEGPEALEVLHDHAHPPADALRRLQAGEAADGVLDLLDRHAR